MQRLNLVLADPFVLLVVRTLPFLLDQLSIVNAFGVPLGVIAVEIAPDAICLFILTTGRAGVTLVILSVGRLHDQLEGEKTRIV